MGSAKSPTAPSAADLRPVCYRFGDFEYHDWPARLLENGQPVPLQPQPARCLELLLKQAGQIVEREKIRDYIWGQETHLEHDQGINYIIRKLREALDDDPSNPRFIETVPRQGYRFVARVDQRSPEEPQESELQTASPSRSNRGKLLGIGAVGLAILIASLLWWRNRQNPESTPQMLPLSSQPITSRPGIERTPDLSPDGRSIAYSSTAEGTSQWQIHVQRVQNGSPVSLTQSTAISSNPRWSPNGDKLAFVRLTFPDECRIVVLPVIGGSEQQVADCAPAQSSELAWTPDGRYLAFVGLDPPGLRLLDLDAGVTKQITHPESPGEQDNFPSFSPDGDQLAFARGSKPFLRDVYVMTFPDGEPERLTFDTSMVTGLAWSSDSEHLVFSSNRIGRPALWSIARGGGEPMWLPLRNQVLHYPTISGQRLAFSTWEINSGLWQVPSEAEATDSQRPWFSADVWEGVPRYSPDGTRVAFVSYRSGSAEVWIADERSSEIRQLSELQASNINHMEWSPDSSQVLVGAQMQDEAKLLLLSDSAEPSEIEDFHEVTSFSWGPDRQILIASNRSGSPQIWSFHPARVETQQLTFEGGTSAHQVGDRVVMTVPDESGFWILDSEDPAVERRLIYPSGPYDTTLWGRTGSDLWYLRQIPETDTLVILSGATMEVLAELDLNAGMIAAYGLSISPDRSTILGASIDRLESDLHYLDLPAGAFSGSSSP